jgi:plastocyanin
MAVAERVRLGTFGWRRLALVAALADVVVFLAYGLGRGDREALAFAVLMLAGAALLWARPGWFSLLVMGALFVNVQVWMFPAANGNAATRVGLVDMLIPGSLVAFSLAGLIGVIGAALHRRDPDAGAGAAGTAGVLTVVFVATSLALVGVMTPARAQEVPPGALLVETRNIAFDPATLEATATDGKVTFAVRNRDLFWHTLTVDALKLDLKVPVGRLRTATVEARPGSYRFYCRIPGHTSLGMRGTLTVR